MLPILCFFNVWQDAFVKKAMKRITQHVKEKDLWIDGEFVSEEEMREELKLKENLVSEKNKRVFAKPKGFFLPNQLMNFSKEPDKGSDC